MSKASPSKLIGKIASLSHNYATKSPLVSMGCPTFTHNCPFPFNVYHPESNTPILWLTPNSIQIQSAILPQYTFRTDRPTDTHTHTHTHNADRQMG